MSLVAALSTYRSLLTCSSQKGPSSTALGEAEVFGAEICVSFPSFSSLRVQEDRQKQTAEPLHSMRRAASSEE